MLSRQSPGYARVLARAQESLSFFTLRCLDDQNPLLDLHRRLKDEWTVTLWALEHAPFRDA